MADFFNTIRRSLSQGKSEMGVAIGVIVVIAMLIIPMSPFVLDMFMVLNITFSILVVMIVLFTRRTLDFSSFPTILLILTIFGLGINISSTRLILTEGEDFGGAIVRAFSTFVVGSPSGTGSAAQTQQVISLVVGTIIFIILIAVQFLVITKGATRVSEVAARFTLDAMPGKQMAIDTALSNGSLNEEEAIRKKADLEMEVGFYGAMDGASKFVSGNVQVGILITVVNILGGIIVGMAILGYSVDQALITYVRLTIGDGLVSQIPALLVSTATGLIVTRAVSFDTIGGDITKQFTQQSKIYYIAGGFMLALALLPGFPTIILFPFGLILLFLGFWLGRRENLQEDALAKAEEVGQSAKESGPKEISPIVPLDPLSLELGYALIPLVDKEHGAELLERVTRIRRESALELGLVVPPIRIIDNMKLEPSVYSVKIKGMEVGAGTIRVEHYMAINPSASDIDFPGEKTIDPAFGLPAYWVTEDNRDKAERAGFTVVDPPSIIATHLTEIIKHFAAEILGRQEAHSIMESLKKEYPTVVEEASKHFSTGELQKIFQGLLKEQVSIRNMVVILETVSDYASLTKDTAYLIEKVRQALARQICSQYAGEDKVIRVLTLDSAFEQQLIASRDESSGHVIAALPPKTHKLWINALTNMFKKVQELGFFPIVLVSEAARALVKASTQRDVPDLVVLSVPEIAQGFQVESLGEIKLEGQG